MTGTEVLEADRAMVPNWFAHEEPNILAAERVFVARRGGDIVGVLLLLCADHGDEITQVVVRKDLRRQGVGRALVDAVLGDRNVWLEVRDGNVAARALYEGLGFVVDGTRPRYYRTPDGGREAAVLMSWAPPTP